MCTYEDVIKMLIKKAKGDNIPLTDDILVNDSFYGTEHIQTKEKEN